MLKTEKTKEDYDTQSANAAAEYAHQCLFHRHRGYLETDDKVILYGNDGYKESPNVQKEVDLLTAKLATLGYAKPVFGQSSCGYSWSLMILDYQRSIKDMGPLCRALEDAWVETGGYATPAQTTLPGS